MIKGLTGSDLGKPDYKIALDQHDAYIEALRSCGLDVTVMAPDDAFPDSTFIEDTCLVTPAGAVITNPGAPSRNSETAAVEAVVSRFCDIIGHIRSPGTLDAGDIMMVGSHFYIGLSDRTNAEGAAQMIACLSASSLSGSTVELTRVLHLKTGVSYLEDNIMLVSGEFIHHPAFQSFDTIPVREDEAYAANSVWINGTVLVPAGFPQILADIRSRGLNTIELDMSEFRKLDGGLSCLSLRF